ncbi:hypothetical protein [Aquabacterium sp.]|uniref:hypothetical protein n=1 Tax=Aquabacterium sp. TaxID=1872578 RepID=UPI002CC94B9E|nr:hypothetical protein [Aquabacterium sp.]HSW09127.1 hypothetical protein [Aquabacterium sp.]
MVRNATALGRALPISRLNSFPESCHNERIDQHPSARHHRQHTIGAAGPALKIDGIELQLIRLLFDIGMAPTVFAGMNWTSVDSLFVCVCTDAGVDGLGGRAGGTF